MIWRATFTRPGVKTAHAKWRTLLKYMLGLGRARRGQDLLPASPVGRFLAQRPAGPFDPVDGEAGSVHLGGQVGRGVKAGSGEESRPVHRVGVAVLPSARFRSAIGRETGSSGQLSCSPSSSEGNRHTAAGASWRSLNVRRKPPGPEIGKVRDPTIGVLAGSDGLLPASPRRPAPPGCSQRTGIRRAPEAGPALDEPGRDSGAGSLDRRHHDRLQLIVAERDRVALHAG